MTRWDDDEASVPQRKLTLYLLAPDHPAGRSKERYFRSFGFSREDWSTFAAALLRQRREGRIVETEQTRYGVKRVVEGELVTPDGRNPQIRSVWVMSGEGPYAIGHGVSFEGG